MKTDILIIGDGIAALVLSKILLEKKFQTIIVSKKSTRKKYLSPETLPPSVLPLLKKLNLLDIFYKFSTKTHSYQSVWGKDSVDNQSFFSYYPFNHGLKIKKSEIIKVLKKYSIHNMIYSDALKNVSIHKNCVITEIIKDCSIQKITSRMVIDASGRNRVLARKIGIKSRFFDRLIASTSHLPYFIPPGLNKSNLVESFPDGWGTVSSIDDKVNVISLFTEKMCSSLKELKNYGRWFDFLKQTNFLKKFLVDDSPRKINFSDASSSILSKVSGDNWLAIGDAAMSFDPIASHGTSNALFCADLSSKVIESFLEDSSSDSILHYNTTLNKIFKEYLFQKTNLYKTEIRWSDRQFWNNFQSVS